MVTLGSSVETFASLTEAEGSHRVKDTQEKCSGIGSSSVHEVVVTSSYPQVCEHLRSTFLYTRDTQLKEACRTYATARVFLICDMDLKAQGRRDPSVHREEGQVHE